ncbi:hypothetical protein [Polyangium mundeleinium]|uniref:Uncharacterized protein n=1 Tax=Polyangium mundeleinium TaxID=2995306 RepID=A0ABT5EY69_9BACT|nr:hypothetical protein [Polyangium mundeleinium]MDC0746777.1 hypothetical protein [Polyangium mundeleinium]
MLHLGTVDAAGNVAMFADIPSAARLGSLGDVVYFAAADNTPDAHLWKTDRTAAGTVEVMTIPESPWLDGFLGYPMLKGAILARSNGKLVLIGPDELPDAGPDAATSGSGGSGGMASGSGGSGGAGGMASGSGGAGGSGGMASGSGGDESTPARADPRGFPPRALALPLALPLPPPPPLPNPLPPTLALLPHEEQAAQRLFHVSG